MIKKLLPIGIALFFLGCNEKKSAKQVLPSTPNEKETLNPIDSATIQEIVTSEIKTVPYFKQISDYPKIKDTTAFITELKEKYKLFFDSNNSEAKITKFQKVKIFGSKKEYIIIENNFEFNNMKCQLAIFTLEGKLISILDPYKYLFMKVFPNQNPFLVDLDVTNQGNGVHALYQMKNDSLDCVMGDYEGDEPFPNTFDRHEDNAVFEPEELKLTVSDENKDGFNDLVFKGKYVLIQYKTKYGDWEDGAEINGKSIEYSIDHPYKKVPIKFVFLYNPKTKKFCPKENYEKKYKELYE